jgi:tRNA threonylcarbamoyladenosine biosynthesis protein TsaE
MAADSETFRGNVALPDLAATGALGAAIAAELGAGDAVALWGDLGAGKTTLARAVLRALGVEEDVPSPTFTLVQFYAAPGLMLAHFDLYRITRPEEAHEIGLDQALDDGAVIIEWPERLAGHLPTDRLDIELSIIETGEGEQRAARLIANGSWEGRPIAF